MSRTPLSLLNAEIGDFKKDLSWLITAMASQTGNEYDRVESVVGGY